MSVTFKQRLLSVAMIETGKQAGSGCRQTAECTECLCKHCEMFYGRDQAARDKKQTVLQMETTGQNMPTIHSYSHTTVSNMQTSKKPHSHRAYWPAQHTQQYTNPRQTFLGTACRESSNWTRSLTASTGEEFPVSAALKAFLKQNKSKRSDHI